MSNPHPLKKFFSAPYSATIAALEKVNRKSEVVLRMKQRIKDNARREHEKNCELCKSHKAMFGGHGDFPLDPLTVLRETLGAGFMEASAASPESDEPLKH